MAIIKYQINGKAETKPFAQTATAATGLFKKVEQIDNKLKAFVGVKVFASVTKAINNSTKEYDNFKKSIGEESAFSKQMSSLKTTMSGTLGTVRDSFVDSLGEMINSITGNSASAVDAPKEAIPKVGAALIAAFKVASTIVANIVKNFDTITNPKPWNGFREFHQNIGSHGKRSVKHSCRRRCNLIIRSRRQASSVRYGYNQYLLRAFIR